MLEEVAVPYTIAPQLTQFRETMVADATVFRLHRLLTTFPAIHEVRREASQPERSRLTLNKRPVQAFNTEVWP